MLTQVDRFFLVAGSRPKLNKYTSGQEYYIRTMISTLKEIGYQVRILSENELFKEKLTGDMHIHFYYVPLKNVIRLSLQYQDARKCFHLYHLEDATWNSIRRLKWKAAVALSRPAIDRYLVTSRGLQKRMEKFTIKDNEIVKVEPFYSCRCNSFSNIKPLIQQRIENISSKKPLKLLYLGRYNSKRLPLAILAQTLKKYSKQRRGKLELKIVSMSDEISNVNRDIGNNFTLKVRNEYLGKEEKCGIYREADFFLYLAGGNVAMNPPITILEAVYHGAIPIVTPCMLKDLCIPRELIAKDSTEVPAIIENLSEKEKAQKRVKNSLTEFNHFYDKSRYVDSLKNLMSAGE